MPDYVDFDDNLKLVRREIRSVGIEEDLSLPYKLEIKYSGGRYDFMETDYQVEEEIVIRALTQELLESYIENCVYLDGETSCGWIISGPDGIIEERTIDESTVEE